MNSLAFEGSKAPASQLSAAVSAEFQIRPNRRQTVLSSELSTYRLGNAVYAGRLLHHITSLNIFKQILSMYTCVTSFKSNKTCLNSGVAYRAGLAASHRRQGRDVKTEGFSADPVPLAKSAVLLVLTPRKT